MVMIELLVLKRLALALLLGGIIGYEREKAHKVAGLRTHTLVCVASALISLVALYGLGESGKTSADASARIIANILVGIGFIGGGAILRTESRILGTTTAATLWTVAAVGIAVGVGFTYAAIAVTLISYLILTILWKIETRIAGSSHKADIENTSI